VTQKALKAKGRITQSYKANPRELIYDFSDPIEGLGGERIGVIRIGVRSAIIDKEVSRIRNRALGLGIIFIIIACVSVFFLSNFTILVPIRNLMLGVSKIGRGELDRGIELKTKDEIGELAKAFNKMAEDLKKSTVSVEVLRNEQKRFRDIAESSEEWIWEVDIKGWYIYSSPMVAKILGYKPQEIYGKYFYDFYPPDDRQETREKVFAAFSREEISQNFLTRNIHKDGRVVMLETSSVPFIDKNGKLIGYRGSTRDITGRKKMEQELKEAKDYAELLFELVPSAVFVVDKNLRVISWNKKAREITGYTVEEVIGKECLLFAVSPCKDKCGLYADDVNKPLIGKECTIKTKDGRLRIISKNADVLKDENGEVFGGIESFDDITEHKKAEEELKSAKDAADAASRAKSDFLANMSHELRTPLNAVIGFSEVLNDEYFGPLNDKQKEYIRDIRESGNHLLSLINNILDLSKVEAGKMELELSEFDLKMTLEASLSMIKEKAMRHNISIFIDIKDDLGAISADERKIKQIMYNLLSNAAKFTPEGGKIGIAAKDTGNNGILITVWDTGIGIEEKDKNKVFSEFAQIDSSLSRKYSGTGLGMPLAKKLVELHGGKIWFESEGAGRGCRFSFSLPRDIPEKILYRSIENRISAARKDNKELFVFIIHFDNYSEMEKVIADEMARGFVEKALQACRNAVESKDLLMQRGKDEIVALCEHSTKDAASVSIRLKKAIKNFIFETEKDIDIDIDINFSYGFSNYPDDGNSAEDLLEKAAKNFIRERDERLKKNIMFVDDDPEIIRALKLFLEHLGYSNFTEASDGEEAVQKLKSVSPDLIILDIVMPKMSGYEVIGRLKAAPETENIPILIISGQEVESDKLKGYVTKRAIPILRKPFNLEEIKKTVKYLL
ncbi:MAG: PAS domain S-box protein, partial [Candidatus Omnitrophica bacterium]|nr:PAS domain S-box protein [Candidatus Omnitrophota bacterium]